MTIDRKSFVQQLRGHQLDSAALRRAGIDTSGLAEKNGNIEGTDENLQKLWLKVDDFDRDGRRSTISDQKALNVAQAVFDSACVPTPAPTTVARGVGSTGANSWKKLAEAGDASITSTTEAHQRAVDTYGVGTRFGDHQTSIKGLIKGAVDKDGKAALSSTIADQTASAPGGSSTVKSTRGNSAVVQHADGTTQTLKESSCIGWAMEHVGAAYKAAGKAGRWAEIEERVKSAGARGTVLAEELQKDGWKAVFYAPEPARMASDKEKMAALRMAEHGQRIWSAGKAVPGSTGIKVDDVVKGYQGGAPSAETEAKLKMLEDAPFVFGVANGGTHTFVGHKGQISEMHWTAEATDRNAMTEKPMRDWEWDTGVYMVPPGYWSKPSTSTASPAQRS